MEFETPVRLADGRYFARVTGQETVCIPNVTFGERLAETEIRLKDASKILAYTDRLVEAAVQNSKAWFNKEIAPEVIASYYQSGYDAQTGALEVEGADRTVCFSAAKDIIESIDQGAQCTVLLQFEGLWFLRKTFGPVWKLVQARVKPVPEPVKCLIQDED